MLHIVRKDGVVLQIRNLVDQIYSLEDAETGWQFHWSVSEGLRLAEARDDVFTISLSEMGVNAESIRRQYDGMNEAYALTTDLSKPLLFVPYRDKHQLIDGWHRLMKAALLGVDVLMAYFLTEEEAGAILVCKLPPGEGMDWGQKKRSVPLAPPQRRSQTLRRRR